MSRGNMDATPEGQRPVVLVLASTYPRWVGDHEPGFVHELCKRLVGTFDVWVVTPSAPGTLPHEILQGVHVYRYRYAPRSLETLVHDGGIVTNLRRQPWKALLLPGFLLGLALKAFGLARHSSVRAVHAHWMIPQGSIAVRLGHPTLVTAHGADVFALRGPLFDRMRATVSRRASAIAVVSGAMVRCIGATERTRTEVLPMGIDLVRFTEAAVQRHPCQLLFVGRLVEKKGLCYLLDAMPSIIDYDSRAELLVVGFGPELPALREQAARLGIEGQVRFVGAVSQEELPQFYRNATVFVAPFVEASNGDREGLGLVVAEAMACGCPVVVGNVGGAGDLLGGGDNGLLVDARKPGALATAIVELLVDEGGRQLMASRGAAFVRTHFGWDAIAARYATLLKSVIRSPRARGR